MEDMGISKISPNCARDTTPGHPCYHLSTLQQTGTMMSYCWPILLEFHPQIIGDIRAFIESVSCLRIGRDTVYVDWSNGGYEDGTETNPFNTVLEAVETALPDGNTVILIAPGDYPENPLLPYPCILKRNGSSGAVNIGSYKIE